MKKIFYLSRAAFIFIVLCAFILALPKQSDAAVSSWQKGVSVVSQSATDFGSENFKQSMRNARDAGVNYVSLVIQYQQTNPYTTDIAPAWNAPSDATLVSAIDYIQSLGMKVMLKMHLDVQDNTWRAYIDPNDRDNWYKNYGAQLNHLADIAKQTGAEAICLGTEMISMASDAKHPDNGDRWRKMIADVRARYSGMLTYSAQWGPDGFTNEKDTIGFWGSLDAIGLSAYFNLQTPSTEVQHIKDEWAKYEPQIRALSERNGNKQVIFTEIGYRSVQWAHQWPWNWSHQGPYDPVEQANSYEALFSFWNERGYMNGVHLWHWLSDPNGGGAGNTDYTPQGKPALEVMKKWFGTTVTPPTNPPPTNPPPTNPPPTNPPPTNPPPPPQQPGAWSASASGPSGTVGQSHSVAVTVTNSGTVNDAIVDLEVYNSSGAKVHQQFFEHQNFGTNQPKQFSTTWTPGAPGSYTAKLGVFNNNWSTNYYWNNDLLSISVLGTSNNPPPPPPPTNPPPTNPPPTNPPPQNPPTGTFTTNVWWPSSNATVQGTQPFKAMVEGLDINQYSMYWQVDGDRLNEMANSTQDYPHKESFVDVSGWNWKGSGPYTINFVSKNSSGAVISEKSVNIMVTR